jgi:RNA polymerase sigma factor, sigma-70 family
MSRSLLRTDKEIAAIYTRQVKTVYRVCFACMKNPADTEDAVQDTFFRLIEKGPAFESEEHEKAWLIRTATNICKNMLKHWWRRREDIDDHRDLAGTEGRDVAENDFILDEVMRLPEKYKTAVYLYYYEGYSGAEIAGVLKKPQSTVRNWLHEARGILRERLGDDFDEE